MSGLRLRGFFRVWQAAVVAAAVMAGMSGCHRAGTSSGAGATKQYPVHGVVVSTNPPDGTILLKHEAIPGLMEAMTMEYPVTDKAVVPELHPGDQIAATLDADSSSDGPVNLRLTDVVVTAQGKPDYLPKTQYHVPEAGDEVPDFRLTNQSGRAIDLGRYRGKVVVMTFIYTRCPLADYCPRMSRNFAAIDQQLAADPKLYGETHLLSVSFDPAYDTPKVLKSYGAAYTGRYTKETFGHWEFAAPSETELPKMEQWFDVGVTPGEKGTLNHSLATVVIGRDGKVVSFYPTNDWTVETVLGDVKKAAGA